MLVRSAVVVLVPQAEAAVGVFRRQYDPIARRGMPAHITVLWPFIVPPVPESDRRRLRRLAADSEAFSFTLSSTQRFPNVLWLAPEPVAPFLKLVRGMTEIWPAYQPYGGEHSDVIPHLTVAQGQDATLSKVESAITPQLPIMCEAAELTLMTEADGCWSVSQQYPLQRRPLDARG